MTDFQGYPLHTDVKNAQLKAYNRCMTARNILENHGRVLFDRYIKNFVEKDKMEFMTMATFINVKGIEEAGRHVQFTCNAAA